MLVPHSSDKLKCARTNPINTETCNRSIIAIENIVSLMNLELSRLAAKQKRLQDWRKFLSQGSVQPEELKQRTNKVLEDYAAVLEHCWEEKNLTDENLKKIDDLERQLEELNEEARVRVVAKHSNA